MDKQRIVCIASVAVLCTIGLIFYREPLWDIYITLTQDDVLIKLHNIEKGMNTLEYNIINMERALQMDKSKLLVSQLAEANADVDYLFECLDNIRGNETIKSKRKLLVERVKAYNQRLDQILMIYKQS